MSTADQFSSRMTPREMLDHVAGCHNRWAFIVRVLSESFADPHNTAYYIAALASRDPVTLPAALEQPAVRRALKGAMGI